MKLPKFGKSTKTYRANKRSKEAGASTYALRQHAEKTLVLSDRFREIVHVPEGHGVEEWLAVNIVDFYGQVNMIYSTVTQNCTPSTCPVMNAGDKYEYHWCDGVHIKKPIKVSAPEYMEYLMSWVQTLINDESIFPAKIGMIFPKGFVADQHFERIMELEEEAHLNTRFVTYALTAVYAYSFRHFYYFCTEFKLIDKKELAPLQALINHFE